MTDYTRQRDWFDPEKVSASATIVGVGGIGSFTALALAKLGVQRLTLLDFDTVEEHNIPNQMFKRFDPRWDMPHAGDIGRLKVEAASDVISEFAEGTAIRAISAPLSDGVPLSDVVISALDSMEARAELWQQVKYKMQCKLFLDARLAAENIVLYSCCPFDPTDVDGYESTLHSDDEALELSCTRRSIIDVGFGVASLITRAVRRHYAHEDVEKQVYLNQETLTIHKGGWS